MTKVYILEVTAGRALFVHDMLLRARSAGGALHKPFTAVYTPIEHLTLGHTSRKAKMLRMPPRKYVEALFRSYVFVYTKKNDWETLMDFDYIMSRRKDVHRVFTYMNAPYSLSEQQMDKWKQDLIHHHKDKRSRNNYDFDGYDHTKHKRKDQVRSYGEEVIEIPVFTKDERVSFINGGFRGMTGDITEISDVMIKVLLDTPLMGMTEIKVSPFEIQKAS